MQPQQKAPAAQEYTQVGSVLRSLVHGDMCIAAEAWVCQCRCFRKDTNCREAGDSCCQKESVTATYTLVCFKPPCTQVRALVLCYRFAHPHGHVCVNSHCYLYNMCMSNTHTTRLSLQGQSLESVGCRHPATAQPCQPQLFQHIQLSNSKQLLNLLWLSGRVMQATST